MEGDAKGERNEKGPQSLHTEPKSLQDALRDFFPPIQTGDPRHDFYTMYNKEAMDYDTDNVKKYDEDLNTTLIFAGLFSAVSTAFVIDAQSKLQPDPNEQSAALLRAILLTLNQSAIPGETPTVPPPQENPPSEIVTVTGLLYASLLISLLAAFIAMLGKQWVNRYLRRSGRSVIERCGDRQRKCNGLTKWRLHLFIEILPVMLQIALLLLFCALCKYMEIINNSVAYVLIALTILGAAFYLGITIAGTSYDCPFQTPGSFVLRELWAMFGPFLNPAILSIFAALRTLPEIIQCRIRRIIIRFQRVNIRLRFHSLLERIQPRVLRMALRLPLTIRPRRPPLPTTHQPSQSSIIWTLIGPFINPIISSVVAALRTLLEIIQRSILHVVIRFPRINIQHRFHILLERIQPRVLRMALRLPLTIRPRRPPIHQNSQSPITWLTGEYLATIQIESINDVRCVSWILWNITDPEALNAAIRLAGTIRWFEDGVDVDPPYDIIVSTFHGCFSSNGEVYPGSRDRAYYSGQAILWIHTLSLCKSQKLADKYPLPTIGYSAPTDDHDLTHLLDINTISFTGNPFVYLLSINPGHSPSHLQWVSEVLLHFSWAKKAAVSFNLTQWQISRADITIPLDAMLNRFLTWCIFLDFPPEEEVLKIQDKCDFLDKILYQLANAISSSITTSQPPYELILHVLLDLTKLKIHPLYLTKMAYEWCSMIYENKCHFRDWESLLFLSLEIGFRHLNPEQLFLAKLTHTEHHQGLLDIVFNSGGIETISDLLHAWTLREDPHKRPDTPFDIPVRYLVGLNSQAPFSARLSRLVIQVIEAIDNKRFEKVEVEGLVGLLNHLDVSSDHMGDKYKWMSLLLDTIKSPEGGWFLSLQSWKFMVEYTILESWNLPDDFYSPHIALYLEKAQEWDKLEHWMGIVWMAGSPDIGDQVKTGDLEHVMTSLLRQRPQAGQNIKKWIKQSQGDGEDIPGAFEQTCDQVSKALQLHTQASLSTDDRAEGPPSLSPPILPGGHTFQELLPF